MGGPPMKAVERHREDLADLEEGGADGVDEGADPDPPLRGYQ